MLNQNLFVFFGQTIDVEKRLRVFVLYIFRCIKLRMADPLLDDMETMEI